MTDRARVTEVAPDHHSISIYVPEFNLRFNHFLIKDEEPLLFHTGMKQIFLLVRDAVARVIDPSALRWISFSHFEADECGALVSVNDFAIRQARVLAQDEILTTAHTASGSSRRRMSRITGRRVFCSKRSRTRCCARISSLMKETSRL